MAPVTPSADLTITPAEDLIFRPMAEAPLDAALGNVNWLWLYHRPPLVDACPMIGSGISRTSYVVIPIVAADDATDMRYDVRTVAITSAAANLTVTLEYCTAYTGLAASGTPTTWTNIFTQATATGAGTVTVQTKTAQSIPATAVALRWTVSVSVGTYELHHLSALPAPTAIPTGVRPSGFVPYDDGISALTGAPMHTELLNRCRGSAISVLRDRRIMRMCLAADETQANCAASETDKTALAAWPQVTIGFPYAGETVDLAVYALATVSAGSSAGLIEVRQVAEPGLPVTGSITLAASGTDGSGGIKTDTLTVRPVGQGLARRATLDVRSKTTAGNDLHIHALVAIWRPGD